MAESACAYIGITPRFESYGRSSVRCAHDCPYKAKTWCVPHIGSVLPPRPQESPRSGPIQSQIRCPAFVPSTPRYAPIVCGQSTGWLFFVCQNSFQSSMSSAISAPFDRTETAQCEGQAYVIEKLTLAIEKAAEFSAFAEVSAKQ